MIIDQATEFMMKKFNLSEINRSNARIVCEEKLIKDNDTADAVCIALYPNYVEEKKLQEHLVNYT